MERIDFIDEDELIMIIEAKARDRVKKIYPYQPQPKYLLLYAGFHDQGDEPSLILHLSSIRIPQMEDYSLSLVKCFGCYEEAESIYDIVRFTCHDIVKEVNNDTLYFDEFKLNSKGEPCSMLQIIIGIFQAVNSCISDKAYVYSQLNQLMEVWEN
jgi:hypothetical protein